MYIYCTFTENQNHETNQTSLPAYPGSANLHSRYLYFQLGRLPAFVCIRFWSGVRRIAGNIPVWRKCFTNNTYHRNNF